MIFAFTDGSAAIVTLVTAALRSKARLASRRAKSVTLSVSGVRAFVGAERSRILCNSSGVSWSALRKR